MASRLVIRGGLVCVSMSCLCSAIAFSATGDVLREIQNPDPRPGNAFGGSLASFGNSIIVGAPGVSGFQDPGDAYIFDANTSEPRCTWHGQTPGDAFGHAIAVVGNTVAICAPQADDTAGAVYLYDGLTCTFIDKISNPGLGASSPGDTFGSHMTAYGDDKFLIAAERDNTRGLLAEGAVYLYGSDGQLLQAIQPLEPEANMDFGKSSTAVGENVLVGAQRDNNGQPFDTDEGAAYLFSPDGQLLHKYPNEHGDWYFGRSVESRGSDVLITDYSTGTYLYEGTAPWGLIHTFPLSGDVHVIGDDVLVKSASSMPVVLYDGDAPYGSLLTISGKSVFGSGIGSLGNNILIGYDYDQTETGKVEMIQGVPEPSAMSLLACAVLYLANFVRRRERTSMH